MCRALARVAAPDPPVEHGCVPVLAYPAGRRTEAPCFSGTRLWLAGGGGMDRFLVRPDRGDIQGAAEEPAPTGEASGDMQSPGWQHFRAEGLNCDYTVLFRKAEADQIFRELEQEVEYFTAVDSGSRARSRPSLQGDRTDLQLCAREQVQRRL
ncbi:DNA oxidative demethylase ALKBH2 isoform X3 [Rattus norvegicus]|uniref:DNA oxidative demethylase ALKBH2 isoform X3 n=2 Tax=Rattus norvegicus TaxID=10116 RepID=UPI0019175596|nr:DNA oxidative demethylase ALKBH2 isoform X3 [Rattus norvegicus]